MAQPGHDKCNYCELNGGECIHELPRGGWYEQRAKRQRIGSHSHHDEGESSSVGANDTPRTTGDGAVRLPELNHLLAIINLYFDYIHDVFHSLFHKATFIQDLVDGRISDTILYAIVGLALRFYDNPAFSDTEPRHRGRVYMDEAERRFNMKIMSMESVQLSMLLAAGSLADGHMDAENVFHTIACRIAQLIGLPQRLGDTPLECEINLRSKSQPICFAGTSS